jgi:hypothetical protein
MLRLANRTHTAYLQATTEALPAPEDWAGWASVAPQALESLSAVSQLPELEHALRGLGNEPLFVPAAACVLAQDGASVLWAQQRLLDQTLSMAPAPTAWVSQPWGVMSPQAQVHAGAQIQGPVLIGPGCVVEKGVRIGPHSVLSRDVLLLSGASVHSSLIWPGSLIGAGVTLQGCVVNGARYYASPGAVAQGVEAAGALGALSGAHGPGSSAMGRLLALFMWLLCGAGCGVGRWQARALALRAIWSGRLRWFGVRPRSEADWQTLHSEWRALLEFTPVGWLHEPAWVEQADDRLEAEAAADAYYVVHAGWREHLRILQTHVCACLRPSPYL